MKQEIKQRIEQIKSGEVPHGYKKTKIGIVPNEWKVCRAKKIFKNVSDKNHNGELEVLSVTQDRGVIPRSNIDIDIKYDLANVINYKKVDNGDFVISLRSFQGGIEYSDYTGLVSPAYTVLKNIKDIKSMYYKTYFKSENYIKQLNVAVYGIRDGKQISYDDFGFIEIPYPPLNEQQKIADILSIQDKVIELKEKLLKEKEKQKKYLMQNLLTGRKRLKGFNGEWKKVKLGEICYCLDNLRKPLNANERIKIKGNYPYYGANGIVDYINDYIFETDIILLAEDGGNFEQFETKPIAIFVDEKCWVNNHAHILKAKEEYLNLYIFYSLQHKDIRKYINGTTRTKLTKSDMEEIILEISMDIEEQKAIAEILTTADRELKLLQEELEEEKRKKKALMQLLLTGIVRVNS